MLFIIMWATGCTPKAWKISNTILIDKNKGDETEASSYRPIGLANTLYIQTMDASNHKHSLRICRSKLYTQHHASWFSQTERPHSPARKRDYGTRRCQTLSQRHLCPYCGYLPQLSTPLTTIAHLCPTGNLKNLKVQANKPTLYSNWAGLIISGSKTKVTGSLNASP